MLGIYDKKQEIRDTTGEVLQINKGIRWELELSDQKGLKACELIAQGFIENIPLIPLRVTKEKPTMKEKNNELNNS